MYGPSKYDWFINGFRSFFSVIDTMIYSVISSMYQIFFNIASSTIISGEVIRQFFSRVQLILGIIVLFKLTLSLISGIINPDIVTDGKNGTSKIVTRIVTALIMLVLIVPLNIPEDVITNGSYESQLNNNGILFGTMYELQNRVLSQNVFAKLILNKDISMEESTTSETMAEAGRNLASTILKTFVTVNLVSEEAENNIKSTSDYLEPSNRMCKDEDSTNMVDTYLLTNNVRTILNLTSNYCDGYFVFNYNFLISTIVGIIFIVIMVGFTLDIAVRAFKLAVLRLIAPIPIISYIDPKMENSCGTFGKTTVKIYGDLFIRVIVINFAIFVIDSISTYGIVITVTTGAIGMFSRLFVYLGLFVFAKQAPNFIVSDALGYKYTGGLFKGVAQMLGITAATAGTVGSGIASGRASYMSDTANEKEHTGARIAKNIGAGIIGAGTGFVSGLNAAVDAKDHQAKAAFDTMAKRNATALAAGDAGSTFVGRSGSSLSRILFGETAASSGKRRIEYLESQKAALDAVVARADEESVKSMDTLGSIFKGSNIFTNYKEFAARMEAAKVRGQDSFQYTANYQDAAGRWRTATYTMSMTEAEMNVGWIKKENSNNYIEKVVSGEISNDAILPTLLEDANRKTQRTFTNRNGIKNYQDTLNNEILAQKNRNARLAQNDRFSGSNK